MYSHLYWKFPCFGTHTSRFEIRQRKHSPHCSYHVSVSYPKRKEEISAALRFWLVWQLNEIVCIQRLTKALCSTLATIWWQFHGSFAEIPNLFFAPHLNVQYLTPSLTASSYIHETVAGQSDLKSKDCHPLMTTRMIRAIQCDKYFCVKEAVMSSPLRMELFNFMPKG